MHSFDTIKGNEAVKHSLRTALTRRFPQTVLLTGSAGSGKFELARVLAAALLCTGSGIRPCGICASCHKLSSDMHPDLDLIDEGDRDLPVALARALRQDIAVLPNDGDRRVILLRHAHKLNLAAQNALLKVLEEPPAYAFFILTSEQPGTILETIRSRCTCYHLAPPAQTDEPDPSLLALAAPFMRALADADEFRMLSAAMTLEKQQKADFKAVLGIMQIALRDAIFQANGLEACLLPAVASDALRLAARIDSRRLLQLYDHISTLIDRTEINAAAAIQCAELCAGAYRLCFL